MKGLYIQAMRARASMPPEVLSKHLSTQQIKQRRLRRAMIVREIASLDRSVSQIATVTGLSNVTIYKMARAFGFRFVKYGDRDTPLEAAVRKAYAPGGIGPSAGARAFGSSPKTFMVVACRLGLSKPDSDPFRFQRGYDVPAERRDEYKELRKLHLTIEEVGYEMGLLHRPPLEPRPIAGAEAASP